MRPRASPAVTPTHPRHHRRQRRPLPQRAQHVAAAPVQQHPRTDVPRQCGEGLQGPAGYAHVRPDRSAKVRGFGRPKLTRPGGAGQAGSSPGHPALAETAGPVAGCVSGNPARIGVNANSGSVILYLCASSDGLL